MQVTSKNFLSMRHDREETTNLCHPWVLSPSTHQGLSRLFIQIESSEYVAFKSLQPGVVCVVVSRPHSPDISKSPSQDMPQFPFNPTPS